MPQASDEDIAALLRAGKSQREIIDALCVGSHRITRVRAGMAAATPKYAEKPPKWFRAGTMIEEPAQFTPMGTCLPEPDAEAGGATLPEPDLQCYEPFLCPDERLWLVVNDMHIPKHDKRAITLAVNEGSRRGVGGVLINGDLMEGEQFTRHRRKPTGRRFKDDAPKIEQFLAWLRGRFPRGRIVWKKGNHDEWLEWYMAEKAPEASELVSVEKELNVANYGVEVVGDQREVKLGKLPVYHGHEFRGSGGKTPAKWLFEKLYYSGMMGHVHKTDHFNASDTNGKLHSTWVVGCTCFLHPEYLRKNQWNHGFAFVDVGRDGFFEVTNRRILRDGRVV